MSAFKGTPGPWRPSLHGPSGFIYGIEAGPSHDPVKIVKWGGIGRPSSETGQANARLIAAAPELLEACQTFAEWLRREEEGLPAGIERGTPEGERQWRIWWEENLRICDLAQQQVIAAIAKATGEQP